MTRARVILTAICAALVVKCCSGIAGGDLVIPGGKPYQVALLFGRDVRGSGVLISQYWVLTVEQALDFSRPLTVVIGATDLHRQEPSRRDIRVGREDFIIHPMYNKRLNNHNIALIKLPQRVDFDRYIKPIPLPSKLYGSLKVPTKRKGKKIVEEGCNKYGDGGQVVGDLALGSITNNLSSRSNYEVFQVFLVPALNASTEYDRLILSGWGEVRKEIRAQVNILREVTVYAVPIESCVTRSALGDYPQGSQICTDGGHIFKTAVGACKWDYGGPAVHYNGQEPVLVGLISHAKPFCTDSAPTTLTKVGYYMDWIHDQTHLDSEDHLKEESLNGAKTSAKHNKGEDKKDHDGKPMNRKGEKSKKDNKGKYDIDASNDSGNDREVTNGMKSDSSESGESFEVVIEVKGHNKGHSNGRN